MESTPATARQPKGPSLAQRALQSRLWRIVGVATLAAAAWTCFDGKLPTAPRNGFGPGHLAIAPTFDALPSGAPSINLSSIRGVMQTLGGDSVVAVALFQGDSAILVFDVSFSGDAGTFNLNLTAYDSSGAVVFSGTDTIHVTPGDNPPVQPTTPLHYSAPDAAVTTIHAVPNSVQLNAGQQGGLAVTGTNQSGQAISPIHVGWTSRNPSWHPLTPMVSSPPGNLKDPPGWSRARLPTSRTRPR